MFEVFKLDDYKQWDLKTGEDGNRSDDSPSLEERLLDLIMYEAVSKSTTVVTCGVIIQIIHYLITYLLM